MNISGIQVGLDMLISIVFGAAGAIGVWFKLKNFVSLLQVRLSALESDHEEDSKRFDKEIDKLRSDKRAMNDRIHSRIDIVKEVVEKNRENAEKANTDMKQFINDMKVEIIREIHSVKK